MALYPMVDINGGELTSMVDMNVTVPNGTKTIDATGYKYILIAGTSGSTPAYPTYSNPINCTIINQLHQTTGGGNYYNVALLKVDANSITITSTSSTQNTCRAYGLS